MERKAYFKKHEYEEFVKRFPDVEEVLTSSEVPEVEASEQEEAVEEAAHTVTEPVEETEDRVCVDLDALSEEQQAALGEEAWRELKSHVHRWYVIHTYSGYEKVVKENLEQRLKSLGLSARVSDVLIPTEDIMEVKGGKKQVFTKRSFPGYVFVKMQMDDDAWYAIRNTPKVSGFIGGAKPSPLLDSEVDAILQQMKETSERPQPKVMFETGESVRIIDGPFSNFTGVVDNIYPDQGKLKVMVTIFGRSTPVELEFGQVEKGES
ncbi:transcription termination/antitermination factor NusG [candidate division KSB3 bacterium]|uniref:Transcription termination/antitermination protein NusG n=1 Tax=candidate division KSB3 bacterium TaxID=2044937 RepID=A0A9D5JZ11_9BACT|nr:transcription termination/antitermination factor NusG [candidate division KSB3 bacterium]MBD3326979.1 transcription termination/antitermination factor NusG [candidate division KSB3 bacterium]